MCRVSEYLDIKEIFVKFHNGKLNDIIEFEKKCIDKNYKAIDILREYKIIKKENGKNASMKAYSNAYSYNLNIHQNNRKIVIN